MARTDNLSNYLTDVAKAIKDKKGDQTPIKASEFDTEIANLPSGGGGGGGEQYEPKIVFSKYNEYGCPTKALINYNLLRQTGDYDRPHDMDTKLMAITEKVEYPKTGRPFYGYIEEVELNPDRINTIGSLAFYGMTSLKRITNLDKLKEFKTIFNYAFFNCESLESIDLSKLTGRLGLPDSRSSAVHVFSGCKSLRTVIFPENSENFTALGHNVFYNCKSLDITSLPSTLKYIYNGAFYGCTSLTLPSLPDGIVEITDTAFYGCTNLQLTKLPESLTTLGSSAFYGCSNITISELPDSLTKIDTGAFNGCSSITVKSLPPHLSKLDSNVFYSCSSITEMTIGGDVASIGSSAFYTCTSLSKVVIDGVVATISGTVFSGCSSLDKLIIKQQNTITLSNTSALNNTPIKSGTGYIYVPDDLVETYKTATNWVTYASQIKPISELPEEG